uniref:Uncharacterized protein n=1 Tax=Arion vulgaris TaxID=1028688 RepID=A0A0B7A9Q3_9EUPU
MDVYDRFVPIHFLQRPPCFTLEPATADCWDTYTDSGLHTQINVNVEPEPRTHTTRLSCLQCSLDCPVYNISRQQIQVVYRAEAEAMGKSFRPEKNNGLRSGDRIEVLARPQT